MLIRCYFIPFTSHLIMLIVLYSHSIRFSNIWLHSYNDITTLLNVDACINRLTTFCDKLEVTYEKISLAVAGTDGADDIEELPMEDGLFMNTVIDCRDQLVTLGKSILSDKTPSSNCSEVTITEERNQIEQ